jgi:hypothetical protein
MIRLKREWMVLWVGLRFPYRQKTARINVGMWSLALSLVLLSVTADFITGSFGWLPFVLAIGAGDVVMLRRSIRGLRYRRSLDKWLERLEVE